MTERTRRNVRKGDTKRASVTFGEKTPPSILAAKVEVAKREAKLDSPKSTPRRVPTTNLTRREALNDLPRFIPLDEAKEGRQEKNPPPADEVNGDIPTEKTKRLSQKFLGQLTVSIKKEKSNSESFPKSPTISPVEKRKSKLIKKSFAKEEDQKSPRTPENSFFERKIKKDFLDEEIPEEKQRAGLKTPQSPVFLRKGRRQSLWRKSALISPRRSREENKSLLTFPLSAKKTGPLEGVKPLREQFLDILPIGVSLKEYPETCVALVTGHYYATHFPNSGLLDPQLSGKSLKHVLETKGQEVIDETIASYKKLNDQPQSLSPRTSPGDSRAQKASHVTVGEILLPLQSKLDFPRMIYELWTPGDESFSMIEPDPKNKEGFQEVVNSLLEDLEISPTVLLTLAPFLDQTFSYTLLSKTMQREDGVGCFFSFATKNTRISEGGSPGVEILQPDGSVFEERPLPLSGLKIILHKEEETIKISYEGDFHLVGYKSSEAGRVLDFPHGDQSGHAPSALKIRSRTSFSLNLAEAEKNKVQIEEEDVRVDVVFLGGGVFL